jgi:leader peptidase (prepilin peptidase) / N-methyltransferase
MSSHFREMPQAESPPEDWNRQSQRLCPTEQESGIPVWVTETVVPQPGPLVAPTRPSVTAVASAAAVGVALVLRYHGSAEGWVVTFAAVVLVILAYIDLEVRRVPNRIVLPAAAIVLVFRVALDPSRGWVWVAAGFGAAFAFFVLAILRPGGLGMGDVKLVLLIGASLGSAVIPALLVGTLAGAAYGVILLARFGSQAGCRTIAYVPFLASGALVIMFLAKP